MSDDFVRQFPAGVVPIHRPKSLEENLRDDAVEWEARKHADPKLVSQAYDDINDAMTEQHQAAPTDIPDAAERERIVREERARLAAFHDALSDRLKAIGMYVTTCHQDSLGERLGIRVRDSEGRPFQVEVTTEEASKVPDGDRAGLLGLIAEKLEFARRRYFERMGVDLS